MLLVANCGPWGILNIGIIFGQIVLVYIIVERDCFFNKSENTRKEKSQG